MSNEASDFEQINLNQKMEQILTYFICDVPKYRRQVTILSPRER